VVADTRNGAVRLDEMGSGENWLGYHPATFLALHEWFAQEARPVPHTLIMDQPSQVWFPADDTGDGQHVLRDDDRDALIRAYTVITETITRLTSDFQAIVMEHADLEEPVFREAVRYRWRDDGEALIPPIGSTRAKINSAPPAGAAGMTSAVALSARGHGEPW
jgi:Protein of unknown function (DUF3732)